jgi:hypothetical protein
MVKQLTLFEAFEKKKDTKMCATCKEIKPKNTIHFGRRKDRKDGFRGECKKCRRVKNIEDKIKNQQRKHWSTYGLRPNHYLALFERQQCQCGICGKETLPYAEGTNIDHVHVKDYKKLPHDEKRKHVRGILCGLCNTGLGMFRDSLQSLERAPVYLIKHIMDGNGLA